MAITIINTPADMLPVNNNIIWTASSTNTAETAFKYIVEVFIDGVIVNPPYKIKPEPTTGNNLLIIDVAQILRNKVSSTFYNEGFTGGIRGGDTNTVEYQIRIGEQYEVAGTLTQFLNLANATSRAFNGALTYVDFVDFVPSSYKDSLFLTDAPRTRTTDLLGHGSSAILLENSTTLTNVIYKTYLAGVLQNTYTVTTSLLPIDCYLFATGVDSINEITPANFTVAPTQPIINNTIDRYTVEATLSTGSTEVLTFDIKERCYDQDPINLIWLNRFGAYDSFMFYNSFRDTYTVERKSMKRALTNVTSTGAVSFTKRDRKNVDYFVNQKQRVKLVSDWITEEESEWLKDVVSTQDAYIEKDGESIAVNVVSNSYEVKYRSLDELFQLEIEVELAIDSKRQLF